MLVTGPPRGSQAVFDRALKATFGTITGKPQQSAVLVEIGDPSTPEERFSKRLHKLMTFQALFRQKMNQKVSATSKALDGTWLSNRGLLTWPFPAWLKFVTASTCK